MEARISIIIPVYNVELYLSQCIDSCLKQIYSNLEIILVNDGSTDSSPFICDQYKNRDSRVKVIHKKNEGLSSARNAGIEASNGDYICFLDSDDWMNHNAINDALDLSLKYNSDIVFWSFLKEYTDKTENYQVLPINKEYDLFEGDKLKKLKRRSVGPIKEELSNPTRTDSFLTAWGKLYKSTLIKENRLFFFPTHEIGSEDVIFNIQAFYYSKKIIYLNKYYNHYRMFNENSLTKNHKNTLFERLKKMYFSIGEFLDQNNLSNEFYEALNNRFALSLINNCLSISSEKYNASIFNKFINVKNILYDNNYENSIRLLDISYMPFIWKVFFISAKKKYFHICLLMTYLYKKLKL